MRFNVHGKIGPVGHDGSIHWETFIVDENTIEECREEARVESNRRTMYGCWSERI